MESFSITLILLLCGVGFHAADAAGNTTYVVALLGQDLYYDTANPDTSIEYELVMINSASGSISVHILGIDGLIESLDVSGKKVHTLDQTKGLNGSEYSNKTIIVHSQDGFFTLQVFTRRQDHNYVEGLLAIPIESLQGPHQPYVNATVYNYVVSTFCDIGGYCQLAVAALNDKTTVSIMLPKNAEEIALCKGKGYFRTGRDKQITLNKYDALQLETTYDLTGTVIYSFEPIVVFAGSRNVTNGDVVAHTMEQLVPSSHWGTEYIVQNLGSNGYGDILKIVSHWSNTKVTMKGFPPFIMKDRFQTAVRRLDKGFKSHIQASHPIQVVQITGLTYATENETSTLSMTVVPSVQNALTGPVIVACHDTAAVDATFYIVEEKLTIGADVNGQTPSDIKKGIKYSNYKIVEIEDSNTKYTVDNSAGSPVRGVMKCETATMPISVLYNENVTGTTPMTPSYTGSTCYEGGKASTTFNVISETATPSTLDLQAYPEHVLELRVRACGEAVLQFIINDGDMQNSLFLTVTHKQVIVKKCIPDCETVPVAVVEDTTFHTDASTKWDCEADMAFVWFLQKTEGGKNYFCFGMGKYDESVCAGAEGDQYFEVTSAFKMVKMMGVTSDAGFTWDFVHVDGCDLYESDWRCFDRWTNCSMYGTDFCYDDQYSSFAQSVCAKFCGKCFADSYGRKFILKVPFIENNGEWCKILVSPLNKQTNVAIYLTDPTAAEKVVHGTLHDNGERYYDCTSALELVFGLTYHTILSDDDVAVVVIYKYIDEIKSYRIYPVDTFDTEFMMLDYNDQVQKECTVVTEHETVKYVPYISINMDKGTDSKLEDLNFASRLKPTIRNEFSGSLVIFDKPSAVFCGDKFTAASDANYFHQPLPINIWSTEYVIPAFDIDAINRPFDAKLLFVSNADNTIVNITGGFDAVHAIYNRGDMVTQDIDAGAAYKVTASQKIGLAMYVYDPSDETKSSFHLLPSSQNLHDTVVTSVPNTILEAGGYDIKTYFVDQSLNTATESKAADYNDEFYRHVRLNEAVFGMTVVKSGNENWFVVPGNIKSKVQHMELSICNISIQVEGDNSDNECDGLSDEDVCFNKYGVYREDRDLDGGFGEDCSETFTEPVVVSKPIEPMCLEINKPADQCWTVCSCKCSWVEKYEAQKNLTQEELVEAQQGDIQEIQNALHIDTESLPATTAQKVSADDKRQSAASIGYFGLALFGLVFGTIFIMDISSLFRDLCTLLANLREGFDRLTGCFKRRNG